MPSPKTYGRMAVWLLALAGTAHAQGLTELYQAARGFDAAYLSARALAESAPYRAAQSDALHRPNVSLAGSATRTDGSTRGPATAFSNGVSSRDNNSKQVAINARQPLFNRANDATVQQSRRSLEGSLAELQVAEQDLLVRVAQAYFDVLSAQDTLTTTRASKQAIAEQLASAKRNFEVGTATITDTREAQARFDLATAQEIAADNDLRTKRIALDQLVGRSGVQPLPLRQPVQLPDVLAPAGIDDWVEASRTLHPQVQRAQAALEIARLETEKARANHLPTLDLVGSVSRGNTNGDGVRNASTNGTTQTGSVGVQLNLPLYAGNSIQNRVEETLKLEEKARNDLEAAQRTVALQTRQLWSAVLSGRAQVGALEAAESSSRLALEATQLGYRVGVRVNLDVLNAQTQLYSTQRDLYKARYDLMVGALRLRQAAGLLEPGDLQPVEGMLAAP
ncbi:TolC family outer membrane protein [Azohydromonas lata]|uniref:TolC family outer membrane protein n=1 Tax=Azohydromonas lata TaxID=45677 RepID=A0ABU5IJH2_9BURK|nr:TolC family outer membrane protein [Azohydromonas lata]MDZ5459048.1 TolC family outer membrane protein [Azohydromonas lata]